MWIDSLCDRLSAISASLFPSLLDTTLKGLVILPLAAIATIAMRRSSAAARHLVWFLGTISLLLLPILSVALPGWNILPRWTAENSSPPKQPEAPAMVMPAPTVLPPVPDTRLLPNYSPPKTVIKVQTFAAPAPVVAIAPASHVSLSWQAWIILAWTAGSIYSFAFILFGLLSLWQLRRRSFPVTDRHWTSILRDLCIQIRFRRPVELLSSHQRAMPMTWGFWKTWILVPADSAEWTTEQRTVVLMHELAHARRFDCLTQFCTQLVFAVHWFNPLVWIARRQMQIERERACDDLVLATGTRASAYAQQLLSIAAEMSPVRYSAAAIAMARQSTLEGRLLAILDIKRNRRAISWTAAAAAAVLTALIAAPLSMLHADSTPESQAMRATERFAERYGWKAQTVTPTTLESKFGGWRDLPFSLSSDEEADTKASIELAGNAHDYFDGKSDFSNSDKRSALEAILKKRPDAFYPEFLLAHWYRDHDDVAQADRLLDASYRHAPVILVQRFEYQDGSPAADTPIATFSIECNRVQNGSLDPSLKLSYCDLKTDASGCIYLPVYNTVYRRDDMSWPAGYTAHFPTLGWFETSRKVALLPVATITPNAGDFAASASSETPATATATLSGGNAVELLAVSPYADPRNQWWLPDGSPSPRQYTTGEPGVRPWPQENGRRFIFRFSKPLADDAHIQFRFSAPTITQVHYFTEPNQGIEKPYVLFTAFPTHPQTATLRLGEASGRWKFLAIRDPKIHSTIDPLPTGFAVAEAAIDGSDAAELTIEHPQTDMEFRVLAIDKDQVEHATGQTSLMTSGAIFKEGFRFDLPLARVHHFLIEKRTFEWTDFSNIAIQPAANSNEPPAAPSTQPAASGIENSPHSATYRMYDPVHPELAVRVTTKDRRCRQELPDGKVVIIDNGTGTAVLLDTNRKTFIGLAPLDYLPFIQWQTAAQLQSMADAAVLSPTTSVGSKQIGNRPANGVRFKIVVGSMTETRTVWRDPATHRPVEIDCDIDHIAPTGKRFHQLMTNITFDPTVDDRLFSNQPPAGYTTIEAQVGQPGFPQAAASQPARQPTTHATHHFVQIVVAADDSIAFQGKWTTWDDLPLLLAKVPSRDVTALGLGTSSDRVTIGQYRDAKDRAARFVKQFGFEYLNEDGPQPEKSMGGVDKKISNQVHAALTTISTCNELDSRIKDALATLRAPDDADDVVKETARYLDADQDTLRRAAIYVLWRGNFKSIDPAADKLIQLCSHREDATRGMAALALGGNRITTGKADLITMVTEDKSPYARRCAAYALGMLGDRDALPALQKAVNDPDPLVATNAKAAITILNATAGPATRAAVIPNGRGKVGSSTARSPGRLSDQAG